MEREAAVRARRLATRRGRNFEGQLRLQAEQIKGSRTTELQLRKDRAELEAKQQQFELDVQRKLDEERKQIAESARASEAEKAKLREADLQKKLDDAMSRWRRCSAAGAGLAAVAGRGAGAAARGRLPGFPMDTIEEVKKGARGGEVTRV